MIYYSTTNGFQMYSEKTRFFFYMVYAWGLSLLLTFIVFILDSTQSLSQNLRPGIGIQTCFLKSMHFFSEIFSTFCDCKFFFKENEF